MPETILSIDIGGTFIKSALIDHLAAVEMLEKVDTPDSLPEFLASLEGLIRAYDCQITGVAIACPGTIDTDTGFVHKGGLIPYLKNYPLGQYLQDTVQLPISVLNDADAAGLAEAVYGKLKGCSLGAVLVLGTGVGLALVSDGGLISLQEIAGKGLLTPFEDKTSTDQTRTLFQDLGQIFDLHIRGLRSLMDNSGSAVQFIKRASQELGLRDVDGKAVFEALEAGANHQLLDMFKDYCHQVAVLVLNLRTLLQLECVLIGGGISQQPLLIQEVKRQYQELLEVEKTDFDNELDILACQFHNQANLLGAYRFFQDKYKKLNG